MEVSKKYVVYENRNITRENGGVNITLREVDFTSWVSNSFDSEEEVIVHN